jgi:hypothetical protein
MSTSTIILEGYTYQVGNTIYRDGFCGTIVKHIAGSVYEVSWALIVLRERKPRSQRKSSKYSPRGGRGIKSIIACDTMDAINKAYKE